MTMPVIARPERHHWAVDAAVAVVVAAVQVGGGYGAASARGSSPVSGWDLLLLLAGPLSLVARRRWPIASLAVTNTAAIVYVSAQRQGGAIWLSVVVAFATAIYLRQRVAAIAFLGACYVGDMWGPEIAGRSHGPSAVYSIGLGTGLAFMVGLSEWLRLAGERTRAEARSQQEEARRRASEERVRIARELHDVLAHNISVINVQANTALHLIDRQPERARTALSTINDVSKHALVELRSVLGVLRGDGTGAPLTPVATLAELHRLVENTRAAGLDVRLEQVGSCRPLPVEVDLAAYRVVQEALTNSARHSGGRQAVVRICYGPGDLVVEVTDDGGAPSGASSRGGPGNGIAGMTERVTALGGALEVGAMAGRGFRVRACIPTDGGGAG